MPQLTNLLRIPGPDAQSVSMRYTQLPRDTAFDPKSWGRSNFMKTDHVWWELDFSSLNLPDGSYEYDLEVAMDGKVQVVADPYAEEITRFNGYRGIFHLVNGQRLRPEFDWSDELPAGVALPENNRMVIYELPMRWVDISDDAKSRQVGLGTFEKALFSRLEFLVELGINAIELLPVQDSPDTLNWGYGTRFSFAPDFDMGASFDLKLFIKSCHQRGIRVIMDIVMNHAKKNPLALLASNLFFGAEGNRNSWGGDLFKYLNPSTDGVHYARNFHYGMSEYWIREYRVDGFRIDEFNGIDNWDFLSEFRNKAWQVQQQAFPGRPFIVIAEDSARRAEVPQPINKLGKIADSIWDFDFRDEVRRLIRNDLQTTFGNPSRSERTMAMITGQGVINGGAWRDMWDNTLQQRVPARFTDLSQRVIYLTSHDVQEFGEQRLFPYLIKNLESGYGDNWLPCTIFEATPLAFEQHFAAFALALTSVGIPMFLAGECFADLHDTNHYNWREKMSDPVNYDRADLPMHRDILPRITQIVKLRTIHPALQRNETRFFGISEGGFHPTFDTNDGERVFAYCRTNGLPLGSPSQVIVVTNCSNKNYPEFMLEWDWGGQQVQEHGGKEQSLPVMTGSLANIELKPFQVRVFST